MQLVEEEDNINEEVVPESEHYQKDPEEKGDELENGEKKTAKYMTKYERARILGTRALQIRFS